MNAFLQYLFYPNPTSPQYTSPKVIVLLLICLALIILSFVVQWWRRQKKDPVFKKLSSSWVSACRWFGIVGLVLLIARTEGISYVSMGILWVFWAIALLVYVLLQIRSWQMRYYKVLPATKVHDPRSKYLPRK